MTRTIKLTITISDVHEEITPTAEEIAQQIRDDFEDTSLGDVVVTVDTEFDE